MNALRDAAGLVLLGIRFMGQIGMAAARSRLAAADGPRRGGLLVVRLRPRDADGNPLQRHAPDSVTLMSAGVAGAAVLLALLVAERPHGPPAASEDLPRAAVLTEAPAAAEDPVWRIARHPLPIYALETPDLPREALRYEVALAAPDARADRLTWEAAGRPLAHLAVERHPRGLAPGGALFTDLARRAAALGLSIDRLATPVESASKFGPLQSADLLLAGADGATRACLAFRHENEIGLLVTGWLCGAENRPVDRLALACWLDRLDLVSAGPDQALKQRFAVAERARSACPGVRRAGRKLSWLDADGAAPALKTAIPQKTGR